MGRRGRFERWNLALLALLVWMKSPSSGGAKGIAWMLILWPIVARLIELLVKGHLADTVKAAPFPALVPWAPGVAYAAMAGYGLAALLAKQLERA